MEIDESDSEEDLEDQKSSLDDATNAELIWSKNAVFVPNAPNLVPCDQKLNNPALKTILGNDPSPHSVFKYFVNEATVRNIVAESAKFSEDI